MAIDFEGWLAARKKQLQLQDEAILDNGLSIYVMGKIDIIDEIEAFFVFATDANQIKSGVGNDAAREESEQRD
jgi:hypothetical protein